MRTKALLSLFLMCALGVSCSKNPSSNFPSTSNTEIKLDSADSKLKNSQLIAEEKNAEKRAKLLLESMTKETNTNDLNSIIKLYRDDKLSSEEFRSLFWNSHLSKDILMTLKRSLDEMTKITKLDKLLIQSISENNVAFDDLLEEVKLDSENKLPMTLQAVLFDEFIRLYDKDFKQINSNDISLFSRLSSSEESKSNFLNKLKKILELDYYKNILSSKRLVAPQNPNSYSPRDINVKMGFDYSSIIGRCGNPKGHLDIVQIKTDLSVNCPSETPSQANLYLYSKVTKFPESTNISILINSGVIGGYSNSPKEDATTIMNYSLGGKIVIPKCKNPAFCSQIVTVSTFEDGMSFGNRNTDGVKITVNGTYFANTPDSTVSIDVSKQDAVIELSMTAAKKHVGACCSNASTYQKISLTIENDGFTPSPLSLSQEDINSLKTFANPSAPRVLKSFANDFNTPPFDILVVDAKIKEASKNKNSFDDYRSIFYGRLSYIALAIDEVMLNNGSPLDILHYKEIQSSLSDKIGRDQIFKIVQSKLIAYQNSVTLNLQTNINEMFKTILLMNMNNEISKQNLIQFINERSKNLNEDTKEISLAFVNSLESNTKDQNDLLDEMKRFQTEYSFMIKKTSLEMQLSNLELAQFSEVLPTPVKPNEFLR